LSRHPKPTIETLHAIMMNKRTSSTLLAGLSLLSALGSPITTVFAQGTALTYQGRLNDGTSSASGISDLRFAIYDSSGGPGLVVGGFWVLPTLVQTPDAPTLHIANGDPGFATIWWTPPTPGFTLQSTDSLSPTNWFNAPSGTNNPTPIPATVPARFYRLIKL
jgi:hypothetical protein